MVKIITLLCLGNWHIQDSAGHFSFSPNRTPENANISETASPLSHSRPSGPPFSPLLSRAQGGPSYGVQCALITLVPASPSSAGSHCSYGKFRTLWVLEPVHLSLSAPTTLHWSSFSPKHSLCQKCSPFSTYLAPTVLWSQMKEGPLKSCLPVHNIRLSLARVKFPQVYEMSYNCSPINLTVNSTEQGEIPSTVPEARYALWYLLNKLIEKSLLATSQSHKISYAKQVRTTYKSWELESFKCFIIQYWYFKVFFRLKKKIVKHRHQKVYKNKKLLLILTQRFYWHLATNASRISFYQEQHSFFPIKI